MSAGVLTRPRAERVAGGPIDPRLAERRREVERDRGRRRRRRVGVGLGVVTLVGGAYALTRTALVDVDRVEVVGVSGADASKVVAAAAVEPGTPLLDVHAPAVEERVEALAWVAEAHATRHWPGGVEVHVRPRVPVAVDPQGSAVAADGHVIGTGGPARPSSLPRLDQRLGAPGSVAPAPVRRVVEVLAAVTPSLAGEVASGEVVGTDVVLTLVDDITVRIGDSSRLTAKFVAVEALLDQAGRSTIAGLDVRVPSSPSVAPVPGADRPAVGTARGLTVEPGDGA